MSDPNEDRAYELGFVPDNHEIYSAEEFAQMLLDRTRRVEGYRRMREEERNSQAAVNSAATRRPLITSDWIADQEEARERACRDLDRSYSERMTNAIGFAFVVAVLLAACTALLAGVVYASQWIYKAVIG
jgi:hypothetical protein